MPAGHRLIDLGVIDCVPVIYGRRPGKHEKIVPLARRDFGRRAGVNLVHWNAIHDYVGVVLLSPFLGVNVVEPLVILGHEVRPGCDLEGLLLGARAIWKKKERPQARRRASSHHSDQISASKSGSRAFHFTCHPLLASYVGNRFVWSRLGNNAPYRAVTVGSGLLGT